MQLKHLPILVLTGLVGAQGFKGVAHRRAAEEDAMRFCQDLTGQPLGPDGAATSCRRIVLGKGRLSHVEYRVSHDDSQKVVMDAEACAAHMATALQREGNVYEHEDGWSYRVIAAPTSCSSDTEDMVVMAARSLSSEDEAVTSMEMTASSASDFVDQNVNQDDRPGEEHDRRRRYEGKDHTMRDGLSHKHRAALRHKIKKFILYLKFKKFERKEFLKRKFLELLKKEKRWERRSDGGGADGLAGDSQPQQLEKPTHAPPLTSVMMDKRQEMDLEDADVVPLEELFQEVVDDADNRDADYGAENSNDNGAEEVKLLQFDEDEQEE